MAITTDPAALKALLMFHADAGVDVALSETPVDAFALSFQQRASALPAQPVPMRPAPSTQGDARPAARPVPAPAPARPLPIPQTPDSAAADARALAESATDLDALRMLLEGFTGCALRDTARQLVFEDGDRAARVMLVGEAPGADEDMAGKPFVGRSGQLLDRILAAAGMPRSSVYIANIVPWRPPGNRTPTPQEIAVCLPFILRQIELVAPRVLVCLGGPASQLLGITQGITRARGQTIAFTAGRHELIGIPTLHPAFLLRSPATKRLIWRDILLAKQVLDATPAS